MRYRSVVISGVLGLIAGQRPALAQPTEPPIKFWVQTPQDGSSDLAALVTCASGDARFRPIVRMQTRTGGMAGGASWGVLTAQKALDYNQALINAGFPPVGDKSLAIMLVGYAAGRRGLPVDPGAIPNGLNDLPFWQDAPYLAKPAGWVTQADIGTGQPNDWILSASEFWKTPWFEQGPEELSNWLGDFATAYSTTIQNAQLPNQVAFQPARLIFDFESSNAAEASWIDGPNTGLSALLVPVGGQSQADPRRLSLPVRGVPDGGMFDFDGPWNMNAGATLGGQQLGSFLELHQACAECSFNSFRRWEWFNSVMTQTQNAAFARSVKMNFGAGSAVSRFTLGPTPPVFTNFSWQTSDYVENENFPPYRWNGDVVRRFSERDFIDGGVNILTFSYHNYADFNAPVSYGHGTTFVPALAPGQSKSDYVLQFAREKFESVLVSEELHSIPGGVATGSREPYYITPWIAAMNLYIVNADHHRKLLALARAKNCREFNLFMPSEASTPARCAQNLAAHRKIIDQVWGIGLAADQTLAGVVTTGTPVGTVTPNVTISPSLDELEVGDGRPLSIESVASGQIGLPYQNMVRLTPKFQVRPEYIGAGVWGMESVRTSPLVRVNIEVNIRSINPPASFLLRGTPEYWDLINTFSTNVQIKRITTFGSSYVPVPMQIVGAEPGYSPAYGFRYILTGQISNKNGSLFTAGFINPLNPAKCDLLIEFGGPTPFTAHVDNVQVIGASADNLDYDWNHDDAQNGGDLLPFADDFWHVWGTRPIGVQVSTNGEHSAFDMNNDGYLSVADLCAFYTLIKGVGTVTEQDCLAFSAMLQQRGVLCDLGSPPCTSGPTD